MTAAPSTSIRRRLGVIASVAAATALATTTFAPTASAEPVPIFAIITGDLNVAGLPGSIPEGTFFEGEIDTDAGLINGDIDYAEEIITIEALPGVEATAKLTLAQLQPVVGSWDVETGAAEATTQVSLTISDVSLLDVGDDCTFAPIDLALTGLVSGEGDDLTAVLSQDGFTIPPTTGGCGGQAALLNGLLAGSENDITINLAFQDERPPPPPPLPEPPVTTPDDGTAPDGATPPAGGAPAAPGASPVAGSPTFTG